MYSSVEESCCWGLLFPVRVMEKGAMALGEVDTFLIPTRHGGHLGELSYHSILSSYCYWVEINMPGMYVYVCGGVNLSGCCSSDTFANCLCSPFCLLSLTPSDNGVLLVLLLYMFWDIIFSICLNHVLSISQTFISFCQVTVFLNFYYDNIYLNMHL